jgi:hypothetical protein
MPIETAVLDNSTEYIELVQISFNSGTLRLLKGAGIVTALSNTWPSISTTWGQVMALSGRGESAGEIANRDITLTMTSSLRTEIWYGALVGSDVSIWEGNRNSLTGVVDLTTTPWLGEIDNAEAIDGIAGALTLTVVGQGVVLRLPNASTLTSTTSQNKYVTGDTIFDYISGPIRDPFSLTGFDPSSGFTTGVNFDTGFNFDNGFDMVGR